MRRTLGVACACVLNSVNVYLIHVICELRVGFICHTSLSCILTVKSAENKVRKYESTLLQGAGLYIAKNKKTVLKISAKK